MGLLSSTKAGFSNIISRVDVMLLTKATIATIPPPVPVSRDARYAGNDDSSRLLRTPTPPEAAVPTVAVNVLRRSRRE